MTSLQKGRREFVERLFAYFGLLVIDKRDKTLSVVDLRCLYILTVYYTGYSNLQNIVVLSFGFPDRPVTRLALPASSFPASSFVAFRCFITHPSSRSHLSQFNIPSLPITIIKTLGCFPCTPLLLLARTSVQLVYRSTTPIYPSS